MAALIAANGWQATLMRKAWLFSKAALATFGGAHAVLPFVVQGAVVQQQWLCGAQVIDGLALGETTPGPLIVVVAFGGFLGGWPVGALVRNPLIQPHCGRPADLPILALSHRHRVG